MVPPSDVLANAVVTQEPSNAQQTLSATSEPTVWRTIPILEFLQERWGDMAASPKFMDISSSITAGLENLRKWYGKTDDTDAYFICLGMLAMTFPIAPVLT